jgi:hypothetical protein
VLTKKAETAIKAYVKNTDPRDLAYGRVIGGYADAHAGPFRLLPVLGHLRLEFGVTILALSTILLRTFDDKHMGTLGWNLPVNERTEKRVCGLLTSFGWDGRIWPFDAGWPDGLTEETGLRVLLKDARILGTFVFPPEPQGNRVLRVEVQKLSNDFPLSPEIPPEDYIEPTEAQLEKFRQLVAEPSVFLNDLRGATLKRVR